MNVQKLDCSYSQNMLPRAVEGKSETVQRAEVKRFLFFGAR